MKKILLSIGALLVLTPSVQSQNIDWDDIESSNDLKLEMVTPAEPVKESKKEMKEREKRLRELNDDVAFAKAANSMRRGYFVLIADYIEFGRMGFRHYNINPQSNFILVQNQDGIIQYALNMGAPGANGLGGWTGKGAVRNKQVQEKKNGDVVMQYQIIGSKVNATVHITLYHNSKRALARIMGGSRDIEFYGEIRPYRDNDHR